MVFSHFAHLTKLAVFEPFVWVVGDADTAVRGFFVIGGFLIVWSYERASSLRVYAEKRARRIFPAYVTVVLGCAIGLSALSSADLGGYFSSQLARYVAANLAFANFLGPTLPGVFAHNPIDAVNGSLWTLKIEVGFYALVPVLVWAFRRVDKLGLTIALYTGSVAYEQICHALAVRGVGGTVFRFLEHQLPGQLAYFVCGAFLYYHRDAFLRRANIYAALGILGFALSGLSWLVVLRPAALAAIIVFLALRAPRLPLLNGDNDYSYGVYVYHWPLIQVALALGWFASPWVAFVAVWALLAACAWTSWHLIEKRFLVGPPARVDRRRPQLSAA